VQVLRVDGSTFTAGPGSSLAIDKFVYNPASGKGAALRPWPTSTPRKARWPARAWKRTASSTLNGQRFPYHYGIHPTGRYHDWPPIKLYYDGATTGILLNGLTRVPTIAPTPPPVIGDFDNEPR
jgi:hypothetical protein